MTPEGQSQGDSPESAMSRFCLLPDLLHCLGEQIQSKSTLRALCLTNRLFNTEFSYFLYRDIHIEDSCWAARKLRNSPHLRHVRKATFRYWGDDVEFNLQAQAILRRLHRLKILDWQDCPVTLQTLVAVKENCPRLEAFSLQSPMAHAERADKNSTFAWADYRADNRAPVRAPRDLFPSNLRYFNHHKIHGNLAIHRTIIVDVLLKCPNLQHLGLSLYCPRSRSERDWWHFFDNLADEYEESGGSPLTLRSLDLGNLVYPTKEESLAKLTNIGELTSLRVDFSHYADLDAGEFPPARLEAISAINCPKLAHIALQKDTDEGTYLTRRLLHDADEKLIQPPFSKLMDVITSERALSYVDLFRVWTNMTGREHVKPLLPFRMLSTSLASEEDYSEEVGPVWDIEQAVDSLALLVETTKETLQGLAIELPRLLAATGGDEDEEEVWSGHTIPGSISRALRQALPQLTHLTELVVMVADHADVIRSDFLDPNRSLAVAEKFSALLPRLRHIRVERMYWKVVRHWEDDGFDLEEMERYEVDRVELFYRYFREEDHWRPNEDIIQVGRRYLPYLTIP
ncbi:hypothetical protein V8F20_008299 [Naviculisporaceae sp. PSN 640]